MQKKSLAQLILILVLGTAPAWAHNQSPATIKRTMEKAYKAFDVSPPANVLKGDRKIKVAGATADVFDVKKDGKVVGYVAQIEYREETHAVAIDADSKKVIAVVKVGSLLDEEEWRELTFVDEIRKALVGGDQ